jgi:hypothetical protein
LLEIVRWAGELWRSPGSQAAAPSRRGGLSDLSERLTLGNITAGSATESSAWEVPGSRQRLSQRRVLEAGRSAGPHLPTRPTISSARSAASPARRASIRNQRARAVGVVVGQTQRGAHRTLHDLGTLASGDPQAGMGITLHAIRVVRRQRTTWFSSTAVW